MIAGVDSVKSTMLDVTWAHVWPLADACFKRLTFSEIVQDIMMEIMNKQ